MTDVDATVAETSLVVLVEVPLAAPEGTSSVTLNVHDAPVERLPPE